MTKARFEHRLDGERGSMRWTQVIVVLGVQVEADAPLVLSIAINPS